MESSKFIIRDIHNVDEYAAVWGISKLKATRQWHHLRQAAVAREAGISVSTLSAYERGLREPSSTMRNCIMLANERLREVVEAIDKRVNL